MTSELKPCPFCGGKAKYTEDNGEYENHITCHECDFRMSGKWLKDPTTIQKWNTRAVPDVPELVTVGHLWECAEYYREEKGWYGYMKTITEEDPSNHVSPISRIRRHRELVTRDQAAAMLASKDAEIESLREKYREAVRNAFKDAKSAEAKLTQIKAPEPVGHFVKTGNDYYQEIDGDDEGIPLYAAPVDQTVEIERFRSAGFSLLAAFDEDNDLDNPEKFNAYHNLKSALSRKEPL